MTILEIFEKVNLVVPLEQRRFFNYFNDTINELLSKYDGFVTEEKTEYAPIKSLSDDNIVLPLYHNAIVETFCSFRGKVKRIKANLYVKRMKHISNIGMTMPKVEE